MRGLILSLYGDKALHWASEHETDSVRLLLEYGADVNCRNIKEGDFSGYTPLIMNASQQDDCEEVTGILIDAGADVHATDTAGKTALDRATENGLKRIPDVLKEYQ